MPFYYRLGEVPQKRHTQFRKPDGGLYREEVMGLEGFTGLQSTLYHHFLPPRVAEVADLGPARPECADDGPLRHRAFASADVPAGGDPVAARRDVMGNDDVILSLSRPNESMDYYYRNGQAYEVWFAHEGKGACRSQFGQLTFGPGDYLVLPYGTTWRMELEGAARFFVIEAPSEIEPPKRYRNKFGQLTEFAPYTERDLRVPTNLETHTERGEFEVRVKVRNRISRHILDHHPFDVVGWYGYLFPWIFNIQDYEPITGQIHQPPPVHQTFQGHNFVVCSLCLASSSTTRKRSLHPTTTPMSTLTR